MRIWSGINLIPAPPETRPVTRIFRCFGNVIAFFVHSLFFMMEYHSTMRPGGMLEALRIFTGLTADERR